MLDGNLDDTHWVLIVLVIVLLYLWGYPKYLASESRCYNGCEMDYKDCAKGCSAEGYADAELRKQMGQEHYDDKRDARTGNYLSRERHQSRATVGDLTENMEDNVDAIEAARMRPGEAIVEEGFDNFDEEIIGMGLDKAVLESHDQYLHDNSQYLLSNATRHGKTSHREDAGVSWVGRPPIHKKYARTPGGPSMIHSNYEDQIAGNRGRTWSWY